MDFTSPTDPLAAPACRNADNSDCPACGDGFQVGKVQREECPKYGPVTIKRSIEFSDATPDAWEGWPGNIRPSA